MISRIFSPELSVSEQLSQLNNLRLFYLASEIFVIAISQFYFEFDLAWQYIWPIVFTHILLTVAYLWQARQKSQMAGSVIYQSILADISLFAGLLYFSGGATNGAISILLLPVATGAALLSWRQSLSLALIAIGAYSILMFYFSPLSENPHAHHQTETFSTHLIGMWLTFIFSCLLLVWFIGSQSQAVREKQQKLSHLRETQLRDEQLIAIATFSANAAHDLATPLSTISLLCDELKHEEGKEGIDTLIEQVEHCREIVQSISHKAILNKSNIKQQEPVLDYFDTLVQRWLVTRPDIVMKKQFNTILQGKTFLPDAGLESALTNILDNAADASLDNGVSELGFSVELENQTLKIQIRDFGAGVSDELLQSLGKEPVKSAGQGLGLGQFLANATIGRCGGNVWRQSDNNGTLTLIQLPLNLEIS